MRETTLSQQSQGVQLKHNLQSQIVPTCNFPLRRELGSKVLLQNPQSCQTRANLTSTMLQLHIQNPCELLWLPSPTSSPSHLTTYIAQIPNCNKNFATFLDIPTTLSRMIIWEESRVMKFCVKCCIWVKWWRGKVPRLDLSSFGHPHQGLTFIMLIPRVYNIDVLGSQY